MNNYVGQIENGAFIAADEIYLKNDERLVKCEELSAEIIGENIPIESFVEAITLAQLGPVSFKDLKELKDPEASI